MEDGFRYLLRRSRSGWRWGVLRADGAALAEGDAATRLAALEALQSSLRAVALSASLARP